MNRVAARLSGFVLVAVMTLGLTNSASAAKINAGQVFRAALDFLRTDRFRQVIYVRVATDGAIWMVGVDWGRWGGNEGWYARRLSYDGAPLGDEIRLSFTVPGPEEGLLRLPGNVIPVGIAPDSSLVVDIDDGVNLRYLGKVSPNGATEARLSPAYWAYPFVDHDGAVHIVSRGSYMQVDAADPGLPTAQRRNWGPTADSIGRSFNPPEWLIGWRDRPTALLSEKSGRVLVATRMTSSDDAPIGFYMVDTKTLAVTDSGRIDPVRDAYRVWSGPVKTGMVLVSAGRSGYWLFAPSGDRSSALVVAAYLIRPDLSVARPSAVAAGVVRPFDAAPPDAVVSVQCPQAPPTKRGWSEVTVKVKFEFTAYGSDGQLYTQALEDSVTSRAGR